MRISVTGIFGVGIEDLEHRETFAVTKCHCHFIPVRAIIGLYF